LEARHRELSRALHPDRYAGGGAAERRQALSRAIEVNDALRVLKDPVRRAQALLARSGLSLEEGREPQAAPAFLMDVLELREELSVAGRAKDGAAVRRLGESIAARESQVLEALALGLAPLEGRDTAPTEPGALRGVSEKLGELRFFQRLLSEVRAIEDELL
jgi:molecular chaperone HscB